MSNFLTVLPNGALILRKEFQNTPPLQTHAFHATGDANTHNDPLPMQCDLCNLTSPIGTNTIFSKHVPYHVHSFSQQR